MAEKKKLIRRLIILDVIIILLIIPYFLFDRESEVLDDAARSRLGGEYVKLSDGYTHYELSGPESGPMVVLVHGFSTPLQNWDRTAPALAQAGFRVLRYDLFGRGYSDRPDITYDKNLYDRQLSELLAALKIKNPVTLIGLSMGGAISVIFAADHPEKVEKLGLIAPAGFPVNLPFTATLVKWPLIGDYLIKAVGDRSMMSGMKKSIHYEESVEEFVKIYDDQLVFKGYKRAILSTLRNYDLSNQAEAYKKAGRHDRPVVLIWGREDRVVPYENSSLVLDAMPKAELLTINDVGHLPQFEKAELVNAALIEFLKK